MRPSVPLVRTLISAHTCIAVKLHLLTNVMVGNPSLPAKTVPELITYAKANPGKINLASLGNGTERWSRFLRQAVKVDSSMKRMIHHEDAETVFG